MTLTDAVFKNIDLEQKALNLFQGNLADHGLGRVFGGQVLGQALMAASRTVEDRFCHSLHSYFLRAGDPTEPILYEVDRLRDGASFSTRQITAQQKGQAILSCSASFHRFEDGPKHQIEMPSVPDPSKLPSEEQVLEKRRVEYPDLDEELLQMVHGVRPVETRHVQEFDYFKPEKMPPLMYTWFRSRKKLGKDLSKHQSLLAYASDIAFLITSAMPHGKSGVTGLRMASIDHSIWFHRPFNFEDWILVAKDSPVSAGSRGYARASMYTQEGVLVASAVQEGLLRDTENKN